MATLHRNRHPLTFWMSLIVVLVLSACGAPAPTPTTPGSSAAASAQPSSQPSPSAAPASPVAEQPTPEPLPSAAPASPAANPPSASEAPAGPDVHPPSTEPSTPSQTDPADPTKPDVHPPTLGAFYLWPTNIPNGFEIRPDESSADANGFVVEIGGIGGQGPSAMIVGGKSSPAAEPPTNAGQQAEIMVRTSKGMAYQYGAGYSIYWEEQGVPYAIIGDLSLDQAIATADALQSTDLATWQANLDAIN